MFLDKPEDVAMLNSYLAQNPDCDPLLTDALIYCYKYHPEKYEEIVGQFNGELETREVQFDDKKNVEVYYNNTQE